VRPTGQERRFGADELIVSKTDPRGVLTYANDVFLRVSGYALDEVIGRPHKLIRHPASGDAEGGVPAALGHPRRGPRGLRLHQQPGCGRRALLGPGARHPVLRQERLGQSSSRLLEELVTEQADSDETFIWSIISREEH
jgi:PAS domain-containing protein